MNPDNIMTPGRASFAGTSNRHQSPSFRDIARLLMTPSEKLKGFLELERALVAALLIVAFILITLYAVIIVFMPYLRTLMLALLFGSFLHPMKRTLSEFFRRILKEIRNDQVPILAGILMPFSIVDKIVERIRLNFCHYAYEIVEFGRTVLNRDWRSALAICLAAVSLAIIGGNALMNYVMSINLIMFVTDITKTNVSFSDANLLFLVRSFCLAQICWLDSQIICLLILMVLIWIGLSRLASMLKQRFYSGLGLDDTQNMNLSDTSHDASSLLNEDFSFNTYARHSYNKFVKLYDLFIEQLEGYVDTISSACVIGFVGTIVVVTTLYLSFQIYSESIYIIERVSIAANSLNQNNPELKAWLPAWLDILHGLLDGAVKNAYQHGREWIRNSTRQLLTNAAMDKEDFNTTQSSLIEKQMVEFWDRAYAMWLKNRPNATASLENTSLKAHHHPYDWDRLLDAFQSLDFALCTQIFKQNWNTLVSVMDSVMIVLKSNLNLFFGVATATLSLLIGGGNVIMNFIIDLIIFTTALFYLLCASEDQYKPIELIKNLMPRTEPTIVLKAKGLKTRTEFFNSVDESISAVFTASLKMMAFHGLSTWLLHRLFELEVVYIPAVISALFGAVPFVSPYWASLPACLDLYLSGQVSQSILMLVLAIVPSSFVTTAFYSEIKGAGHPYLTGLAIAGGVLVFGIEGALFGPMLLVTIRLLTLIVFYLMDSYK
jgi:predicted PurR-regulated permease PerM